MGLFSLHFKRGHKERVNVRPITNERANTAGNIVQLSVYIVDLFKHVTIHMRVTLGFSSALFKGV